MPRRILIVDDSSMVRAMFEELFRDDPEYDPAFACSGGEAIEKLREAIDQGHNPPFDFFLTDINMPDMDGFETLEKALELAPDLRTGMITGFNVDDYINMALNKGVYNIICKVDPPEQIIRSVKNLTTGNGVFGAQNYLTKGTKLVEARIEDTRHLKIEVEKILDYSRAALDEDKIYGLKTGLIEMGTNAIYHAYGYEKGADVHLRENEKVVLTYGRDEEKLVISILDVKGLLTREKVVSQLNKGINPTQEDLISSGGRGIYLTRFLCDRVIINLEQDKRTEIILVMYYRNDVPGNKPLLINKI